MKYLLDTNSCIEHFRRGAHSAVSQRLISISVGDAAVCSVVRAELAYGACRSRDPQASLIQVRQFLAQFHSLPFDDASADHYGSIREHLR